MRVFRILFWGIGLVLLSNCSVKLPVTEEYQLTAFSGKQLRAHPSDVTLFVAAPDAVAGYQTEEMLYVSKPFQLESFVKNAWTAPPADMLYPLLLQSLQRSGYFYAVTSTPYSRTADYRLNTQVLSLEQNFLKKPSVLDFVVKVSLTRTDSNKVIASKIISSHIPCPFETPYGGVVAANRASMLITAEVTNFVIRHAHGYSPMND